MAVADTSLCVASDIKSFLGLTAGTDTAIIEGLIDAYSARIVRYIGGPVINQTYTNERYDWTGTNALMLRQSPIVSVSSLTRVDPTNDVVKQTYTSPTDYVIDKEAGRLRLHSNTFPTGIQNINVTYTAGQAANRAALETPIKQGAVQWVSRVYLTWVKAFSAQQGEPTGLYMAAMPKDVQTLVDPYRRFNFG